MGRTRVSASRSQIRQHLVDYDSMLYVFQRFRNSYIDCLSFVIREALCGRHKSLSSSYLGIMEQATARLDWILEDRNRILLHILFWIFIYLDEILALTGVTSYPNVQPLQTLLMFLMDALIVYFNLYLLIASYLIVGRIWMYIAFTLISIFINIEFGFLLQFNFFEADLGTLPDNAAISQLISDFAFTTFMLGTAIGAHMLRRNLKSQREIRKLETEKLSTELKFLKNQINPHFLFNSLNNIYVQTRTRPKQASESILLLSDLLRYQLYDCTQDYVKLKDEIQYLQNYLELERLRRNDARIDYSLKGSPKELMIAPFLFIPFVENAVKHGATNDNTFYIDIRFRIEKEQQIFFSIANSIDQRPRPKKAGEKRSGGIGLANVKRRLQLIYPEKHELKIEKSETTYKVELQLNLEK